MEAYLENEGKNLDVSDGLPFWSAATRRRF